MKVCRGCQEPLPLDSFPPEKRTKDGRGATCRLCRSTRQKATRASEAGDHERRRVREWRRQRREDPEWKDREREQGRKHDATARRRHGLTPADKREWLDSTGWKCDVCQAAFETLASAHVDHDHGCCPGPTSCGGCIRGVLCHGCNTSLGLLREDRDRLHALILYLDRYKDSLP